MVYGKLDLFYIYLKYFLQLYTNIHLNQINMYDAEHPLSKKLKDSSIYDYRPGWTRTSNHKKQLIKLRS